MTEPTKHTIRLGAPWDATSADGATRHARKFGRPRTIDPRERVWLVCAHVPGAATIRINDTPVGSLAAPGVFAADITVLLAPRNEVVLAVTSPEPLGAVVLEIRSA